MHYSELADSKVPSRLLRYPQADEEHAAPQKESGDTHPHGDAPVGCAAQRRQGQGRAQRAMKPGSEQADEADQGCGSPKHQACHDENKTEAKHDYTTPLLAFRVVRSAYGCKSELVESWLSELVVSWLSGW
jgi:hypothetical protein